MYTFQERFQIQPQTLVLHNHLVLYQVLYTRLFLKRLRKLLFVVVLNYLSQDYFVYTHDQKSLHCLFVLQDLLYRIWGQVGEVLVIQQEGKAFLVSPGVLLT